MTENRAGEDEYREMTGMIPESTVSSIFEKSEHDEIMEKLKEIKDKLDNLSDYVPIIPYPYPCDPCNPWTTCPDGTYYWSGSTRYGCYTI